MSKNESHAEIVKRMQNFARQNNSWPCSEDIKAFAVKLDAAHRREVTAGRQERPGNAAKLREAAVAAYDALEKLKSFSLQLGDVGRMREFSHLVCLAKNRLDAALSAPPRNCDVGTAEEQTRRLRANCERHKPSCKGCECLTDIKRVNCWLAWAQMPYESEAAR